MAVWLAQKRKPSLRAKRSNPAFFQLKAVITGLVPVILVLLSALGDKDVVGRAKPGHHGRGSIFPAETGLFRTTRYRARICATRWLLAKTAECH
jgi:hypothetical protein